MNPFNSYETKLKVFVAVAGLFLCSVTKLSAQTAPEAPVLHDAILNNAPVPLPPVVPPSAPEVCGGYGGGGYGGMGASLSVEPTIAMVFKGVSKVFSFLGDIFAPKVQAQSSYCPTCPAGTVYSIKLAWDAAPDATVTGYKVHIGTASRTYTRSFSSGANLTITVDGLTYGQTFYFTATSVNAQGVESPYSNEIFVSQQGQLFTPLSIVSCVRVGQNAITTIHYKHRYGPDAQHERKYKIRWTTNFTAGNSTVWTQVLSNQMTVRRISATAEYELLELKITLPNTTQQRFFSGEETITQIAAFITKQPSTFLVSAINQPLDISAITENATIAPYAAKYGNSVTNGVASSQWIKDGTNLADSAGIISGSTTNNLNVVADSTSRSGTYKLKYTVTGPSVQGATISTSATVAIVPRRDVQPGKNFNCQRDPGLGDTRVYCAGDNTYDQLGNGATKLGVEVASGGYHACALKANGRVVCWGDDDYGQLKGLTGSNYQSPIPLDMGYSNVVSVATAGYHSCAVLKTSSPTGNVRCWGDNTWGQTNIPASIGNDAVKVDAGWAYSCALLKKGTVTCWGSGSQSLLNTSSFSKVKDISLGWYGGTYINSLGQSVSWGGNGNRI